MQWCVLHGKEPLGGVWTLKKQTVSKSNCLLSLRIVWGRQNEWNGKLSREWQRERRTHLLQRGNSGGTIKISAAPLQGDDATIEILIIRHLASQHCRSSTGGLWNPFWFSHCVQLLLASHQEKGNYACLSFPFILYFSCILYLLVQETLCFKVLEAFLRLNFHVVTPPWSNLVPSVVT